jgi:hypothetical protein
MNKSDCAGVTELSMVTPGGSHLGEKGGSSNGWLTEFQNSARSIRRRRKWQEAQADKAQAGAPVGEASKTALSITPRVGWKEKQEHY